MRTSHLCVYVAQDAGNTDQVPDKHHTAPVGTPTDGSISSPPISHEPALSDGVSEIHDKDPNDSLKPGQRETEVEGGGGEDFSPAPPSSLLKDTAFPCRGFDAELSGEEIHLREGLPREGRIDSQKENERGVAEETEIMAERQEAGSLEEQQEEGDGGGRDEEKHAGADAKTAAAAGSASTSGWRIRRRSYRR